MLLRTVACQSRACRAFCSPWPWKVCGFAAARSVLRSPGRKAALSCTPGTSATCQLACPTGDSGDAGNAGAPFRAMGGELGKLIKRETEGGGRGRNGGRRSRSAAKPQSDRWSPKRFAPTLASLRFHFSLATTGGVPTHLPFTLLYSTFWRPKKGLWRDV